MRIVVVAPEVPYPGIPHAGGQYLLRHLDALARRNDVTLVAPSGDAPVHQGRLRGARWSHIEVDLARHDGARRSALRARMTGRVHEAFRARAFHDALLADPHVRGLLARCDLVDLQWASQAFFAPRLRRLFPSVVLTALFHDVLSQTVARRIAVARPTRRPAWTARFVVVSLFEHAVLRALDASLVFSEKDRQLLLRRRSGAAVTVIDPPLDTAGVPDEDVPAAAGDGHRVLFVAAFSRSENDAAARWLLAEIWPSVVAAVPTAELVLAGSGAGADLIAAAGTASRVVVTGYVEDLDPWYRSASVAVSPIRVGAGVKFESLTSMLWGLPVVTTRVGAEGIEGPSVFWAVQDDPDRFAAAVISALLDPVSTGPVAQRARRWSRSKYSGAAHTAALEAFAETTARRRRGPPPDEVLASSGSRDRRRSRWSGERPPTVHADVAPVTSASSWATRAAQEC